ncbi:hypothetical protein TNIN_214821 [Trichonephila inaurata madagascariensis]|uniref:Uncharacterized protein n=1 Tax=Trichonephila inaurata madagascariensis TaxID=2747483 RepID=A0A8X6WW29_9ARAC|nr:hypothetical protein TNIN_214821 [Trichonephila inaurata madagascariensis]
MRSICATKQDFHVTNWLEEPRCVRRRWVMEDGLFFCYFFFLRSSLSDSVFVPLGPFFTFLATLLHRLSAVDIHHSEKLKMSSNLLSEFFATHEQAPEIQIVISWHFSHFV